MVHSGRERPEDKYKHAPTFIVHSEESGERGERGVRRKRGGGGDAERWEKDGRGGRKGGRREGRKKRGARGALVLAPASAKTTHLKTRPPSSYFALPHPASILSNSRKACRFCASPPNVYTRYLIVCLGWYRRCKTLYQVCILGLTLVGNDVVKRATHCVS